MLKINISFILFKRSNLDKKLYQSIFTYFIDCYLTDLILFLIDISIYRICNFFDFFTNSLNLYN